MPPTIDWPTKVITVPKSDTSLVSAGPPEIRSHNTDTFRLQLKDLEDSVDGMVFPHTHTHTAPVTVGGVTLARVVEIINGYTITYENGSYAVNLDGSNNNIGDVLNLNNVQVRSNNSAGLTYSKQVEDQSFLDQRVSIDVTNGQAGTAFPLGTPGSPVNNLADAQTIISQRTLPKRIMLTGNLTIGATDNIDDYDIMGTSSHAEHAITLTSGCSTSNLKTEAVNISGTASGDIHAFDGVIDGLTNFEGSLVECGIKGTITLANADAGNVVSFINCHSMVVGVNTPIIDCNSIANLELNVRGYHGGIEIQNMTLASMTASIDLDSANVTLNANNTNGTVVVRGVGTMTDNSAGTTVVKSGLVEASQLTELWQLQGLDADNAMTVTPTSRVAGAITQTITGDGDTTSTVTRT